MREDHKIKLVHNNTNYYRLLYNLIFFRTLYIIYTINVPICYTATAYFKMIDKINGLK
jgi:hypothetical protein